MSIVMRAVARALPFYQNDHGGLLPPRLNALADGGYLPETLGAPPRQIAEWLDMINFSAAGLSSRAQPVLVAVGREACSPHEEPYRECMDSLGRVEQVPEERLASFITTANQERAAQGLKPFDVASLLAPRNDRLWNQWR